MMYVVVTSTRAGLLSCWIDFNYPRTVNESIFPPFLYWWEGVIYWPGNEGRNFTLLWKHGNFGSLFPYIEHILYSICYFILSWMCFMGRNATQEIWLLLTGNIFSLKSDKCGQDWWWWRRWLQAWNGTEFTPAVTGSLGDRRRRAGRFSGAETTCGWRH